MVDRPTEVPGISIRRIRRRDYLVIRIHHVYEGRGVSIRWLARQMRLPPEAILNALLSFRSNAPAVRELYENQVGDEFPGLAIARRELRDEATTIHTSGHDAIIEVTDRIYLNWRLLLENGAPVVLPFSQRYLNVMAGAIALRQQQIRLHAVTPAFEGLERELRAIHSKASLLNSWIEMHTTFIERTAGDLEILEVLDGMIGTMLRFPKESVPVDDRRDVEALRRALDTLREEARRNMIENPADPFLASLVRDKNQDSAELLALIEAPAFVDHIRSVANNRDLLPQDLWEELKNVLHFAFRTLLHSPEAENALSRHIDPLIQALASIEIDLTGISAPDRPDFDRAIREVPTRPPPDTVLVILSGVGGVTGSTVGNYPGPNTLLVSILEIAAPLLLARAFENASTAEVMAGRLYRTLVSLASVYSGARGVPLSLDQQRILIRAINDGNLRRLRDVNWSSRFLNSAPWGAVLAIAGICCFIAAIRPDDPNLEYTLVDWANIISSGTTATLGVSVFFGRWITLIREGIVRGIGGKIIGMIGGIAVAIAGVQTAIDEYHTGDTVGMWVGIATATGGILSVAGFLVAAGLGATATVGGAPLGVVLMAVGAVIGIGAGIVSTVRAILTAGTQTTFEAYINHFGRVASPYESTAASRPSLRQAYERVQEGHHPVDFWDISPEKIPQLFDLGFGFEGENLAIEAIVDEDETFVRTRLLQARRITQ